MNSLKRLSLLALLVVPCLLLAKPITPVGKWIQIDDQTQRPHSVIEIAQKHGILEGKIVKVYPLPHQPIKRFCDQCRGAQHNAPIIGLVIMRNFQQASPTVWQSGTILDPDSGKIYKCKLTLTNGGNTLKVRGYIGISMFGRTQVWQRQLKS